MRENRYLTSIVGAGYAVFAVANTALTNLPDLGDSNATTASFYASHSHRLREIVAAYLGIAAACLFVIFIRRLTTNVLALVTAGAFAATMVVAQAAFLAPAASVSLGYSSSKVVDTTFARGASTLGDAVFFGGFALAAIAVVAVASTFTQRWLRLVGYLLGGLSLVGTLTFFPALLLPAWAAVTAVGRALDRRTEPQDDARAPTWAGAGP